MSEKYSLTLIVTYARQFEKSKFSSKNIALSSDFNYFSADFENFKKI